VFEAKALVRVEGLLTGVNRQIMETTLASEVD
jgi:hypothetical protein